MNVRAFCDKAAEHLAPKAKFGFDWAMVLQIVMQILQNCPQRGEKLLNTIKAPGLFDRWRFDRLVAAKCQECCMQRFGGDAAEVSKAIREAAAALTLADLKAITDEADAELVNPGF